jgi:hypothetical protein
LTTMVFRVIPTIKLHITEHCKWSTSMSSFKKKKGENSNWLVIDNMWRNPIEQWDCISFLQWPSCANISD